MTQRLPFAVLKVQAVTILSGATASNTVDIQNYVLAGIEFPSAMTGTGLTLTVSQDDTTYVTAYQDASDVTITKQNSKLVMCGTTYRTLDGLGRYLRINSSGAEGADRTFKLYLVPRS